MDTILTEIVGILIGALQEFGTGLGAGIQTIVTSLFIDSTGDTEALSVFGGMVVVFAAIGLTVSLSTKIFGWLATLGGRK